MRYFAPIITSDSYCAHTFSVLLFHHAFAPLILITLLMPTNCDGNIDRQEKGLLRDLTPLAPLTDLVIKFNVCVHIRIGTRTGWVLPYSSRGSLSVVTYHQKKYRYVSPKLTGSSVLAATLPTILYLYHYRTYDTLLVPLSTYLNLRVTYLSLTSIQSRASHFQTPQPSPNLPPSPRPSRSTHDRLKQPSNERNALCDYRQLPAPVISTLPCPSTRTQALDAVIVTSNCTIAISVAACPPLFSTTADLSKKFIPQSFDLRLHVKPQ